MTHPTRELKDDETWCVIHNIIEAISDSYDWVCFECGHAYRSAQEIIDEDLKARQEFHDIGYNFDDDLTPVTDIDKITFCPLCVHDW